MYYNPRSETVSADNINVAVIGSGHWGKNLVRNYYELGNLSVICDSNQQLLENYKKQYTHIDTCHAFNDVINKKYIDAVVIATPAETHYSLAKEALIAGKHVYVEKPLSLQIEEGKELVRLADKNELVFMVGHLLQYHPAFIRLKEMSLEGELGRIQYVYSHRLNLGKMRREENILWSFAPHDISMILALANEYPDRINSKASYYLHNHIADITITQLGFPSGLNAHIFVSWLHPFKEQKLVVVGDRKMAMFDDMQPWASKLALYPHRIKWINNTPVPDKANPEYITILEKEPLKAECEHFLDCICNKLIPLTSGDEGLRVLAVLNASQKSLDEEHKPLQSYSEIDHSSDRFIHSTSIVDENTTVGGGTKIWHFCHVLKGTKIGPKCNIGQNVVIGPDVTIGEGCRIQNNVSIYKGVTLKDYVFCGPSMVFTNVINPRAAIQRMDEVKPTLVNTGASLGANCTIVCGNTIGHHAFVGAGAVVTKDVPDYALVVGNPARRIGWMCQCGIRLNENFTCPDCGTRYERVGNTLRPK